MTKDAKGRQNTRRRELFIESAGGGRRMKEQSLNPSFFTEEVREGQKERAEPATSTRAPLLKGIRGGGVLGGDYGIVGGVAGCGGGVRRPCRTDLNEERKITKAGWSEVQGVRQGCA